MFFRKDSYDFTFILNLKTFRCNILKELNLLFKLTNICLKIYFYTKVEIKTL